MWNPFRNYEAEQLEQRLIDERHDHSRHVLLILNQFELRTKERDALVERMIAAHADHTRAMELLHAVIEGDAMRERLDLKKAHAAELNRVIEENQKLKDDMDRLRLLITPALQSVELPKERTEPQPPVKDRFPGTPWMKIQQREIAKQDEVANKKLTRPAAAPLEGDPNGVSSERRVDAPLGGESKPA